MPGLAQAPHAALPGQGLDNRRIAAALIDAAAIGVIVLLLRALTGALGGMTLVLGVAWALYYYFAFEWGLDGQTPGKRLMGLRVMRADGERAGVREIALRTGLRLVDGIGFYLVGLAAMLATGERRQRVGDLVAGTVVTGAEAQPALQVVSPEEAQPAAPLPETEPVLPAQAPVEPEPEVPAAEAPVEVPNPPIPDEPREPEPPPEPSEPVPQEPEQPDVPVPPPPPMPEPEPPAAADEETGEDEETPEVRTEGIEIASEIDLVMGEDEEEPKPPEGGGTGTQA